MIVELPPTFYWDRIARDIPTGTLIREKSRVVVVEMDEETARDVLSDAEYYSDPGCAGEMIGEDPGMIGLVSSARATVRRLRKVVDPVPPVAIRTYIFANPGEGFPRTIRAHGTDEASARRAIKRDLARTADWPLSEVRPH